MLAATLATAWPVSAAEPLRWDVPRAFMTTEEDPTIFVRPGHALQVLLQRAHAPGEVSVVVLERQARPAPAAPEEAGASRAAEAPAQGAGHGNPR